MSWKRPVTEPGQPCRHCGAPVAEQRHKTAAKPTKSGYYYERWLKCSNKRCRTIYLLESEKRWFDKPGATPQTQFTDWFADSLDSRT